MLGDVVQGWYEEKKGANFYIAHTTESIDSIC